MKKKQRYLTFLYHEAVDNNEDSGFQRKSAIPYKHPVKEFRDNIDIIVANTSPIITIHGLSNHEHGTLLSFDDGGKSSILIADYLEQHNLRGHFFITTGMIGSPHFLNESQIAELHKKGHIIGSHSHSHPNVFKNLSYDMMMDEWTKSKQILERILNSPVDTCSIPGGDASKDSYRSAKESGYKILFDSEPCLTLRKYDDLLIMGRICPKQGTSYDTVRDLCHQKGIKKEILKRKIKNMIKTIISPIYTRIYK